MCILKHQVGSICDIQAFISNPKHPVGCIMQHHFCLFLQNGLLDPSPSHYRGHEPGGPCFVLPKEAWPPLSLFDPGVNWIHLAQPRPIQLWNSVGQKHLTRARITWGEGVGGHTHAHTQRTCSVMFHSQKLICVALFLHNSSEAAIIISIDQ